MGDSREDLGVASQVATCWLVANAIERDPTIREAIAGLDARCAWPRPATAPACTRRSSRRWPRAMRRLPRSSPSRSRSRWPPRRRAPTARRPRRRASSASAAPFRAGRSTSCGSATRRRRARCSSSGASTATSPRAARSSTCCGTAAPPPGVELLLVRNLNPDGLQRHTRQNAHGVDLNRNSSQGRRFLGGPTRHYAGPRAFSEPETRAIRALILRVRPAVTVWYHQPFGLVDRPETGGDAISRAYARVSGLRFSPLTPRPGSMSRWENVRVRPEARSWSSSPVAACRAAPRRAARRRRARAGEPGRRCPRSDAPSPLRIAHRRPITVSHAASSIRQSQPRARDRPSRGRGRRRGGRGRGRGAARRARRRGRGALRRRRRGDPPRRRRRRHRLGRPRRARRVRVRASSTAASRHAPRRSPTDRRACRRHPHRAARRPPRRRARRPRSRRGARRRPRPPAAPVRGPVRDPALDLDRAPLPEVLDAIVEAAEALFGDEMPAALLADEDDPGVLVLAASRGLSPGVSRVARAPAHRRGRRRPRVRRGPPDRRRGRRGLARRQRVLPRPRRDRSDGRARPRARRVRRQHHRRDEPRRPPLQRHRARHPDLARRAREPRGQRRAVGRGRRSPGDARRPHGAAEPARCSATASSTRSPARSARGAAIAVLFCRPRPLQGGQRQPRPRRRRRAARRDRPAPRRCVRAGDTAARVGGDEFAVLLEDLDGAEAPRRSPSRIVETLRAPFAARGREVFVRASASASPSARDDAGRRCCATPTLAMYRAKDAGRGRVRLFAPRCATEAVDRLELEARPRRRGARARRARARLPADRRARRRHGSPASRRSSAGATPSAG